MITYISTRIIIDFYYLSLYSNALPLTAQSLQSTSAVDKGRLDILLRQLGCLLEADDKRG